MTTSSDAIGLIGVGLLGSALANRLLQHGYAVLGYDRDPQPLESLRHQGGLAADSAAQVVAQCTMVLFCLPDDRVVASVIEQMRSSLRRESVLIDVSTGDPQATSAMAQRLQQEGITYVDAAIVGSSVQAQRGEALILVGGPSAAVDACEPILAVLSKRFFYLGDCGTASQLKLIVNLVLGLHRAVLAEALALADACGLDLNRSLEVLMAGPAYSAAMTTKGKKMIDQEFSAQARLSQHLKDVGLIQQLARQVGAATPLETTHEQLLRQAVALGYGDADNSAIIKAYGL